MNRCLLCGKNKELCEAHVFPKWYFKALYPNDRIEGKSLVMISDSQNYTKRKRDGIKDNNILCNECDSKILAKLSISNENVFVLQWEFFEDSINFELLKRNLHKI